MARAGSIGSIVEETVARSADDVFLTSELARLGGYDQVRRALRAMVRDGKLEKLGYGVYARTQPGYFPGTRQLSGRDFMDVATKALDKLGVRWAPGSAMADYNAGATTQMPANPVLKVPRRFSRRLSYKKAVLRYETRSS